MAAGYKMRRGDLGRMRVFVFLCQLLIWSMCANAQSVNSRLEGCRAPSKLGSDLNRLQQTSWETITSRTIVNTWPSPLDDIACERSGGCRLLVSKDRVIRGKCECCETFSFRLDQKPNGSREEHLENVILHYSATTKVSVIDAAKTIGLAVGLTKSDVEKIGSEYAQRYQWDDSREDIKQSYVLELRFSEVGNHWEVFLSLAADKL